MNLLKLKEEVDQEIPVMLQSSDQFEARFAWVGEAKEKGNLLYKEGNFQEAIDQYLKAFCGLAGFKIDRKTS